MGIRRKKSTDTEIYKSFEIETFLEGLNEKLFQGKGSLRPSSRWYGLDVNPKQSYRLTSFNSGMELYILRKNMALKKARPFHGLGIEIIQSMNDENKAYSVAARGILRFKAERGANGSWHKKSVFFNSISNGRCVSFNSMPSQKEISRALNLNIEQVLRELSFNDLIPKLSKNENN